LGYARSKIDIKEFLTTKVYKNFKVKPEETEKFEKFVSLNSYLSGSYDEEVHFKVLNDKLLEIAKSEGQEDTNRIFYFALPPTVYKPVIQQLSLNCQSKDLK
jgi:glucose-6-phosphate 1-dehydrogenase